MQRQVMVLNVMTYNALISACDKGQQAKQALEMLQAMQLQGVVPNVITYNVLISACEKLVSSHGEQALQHFTGGGVRKRWDSC